MVFEIWSEKWRPQKLSEVINQEHVVERLKAFIQEGSIPNMIFAGPSGTGKTTCAIILAKELFGENWRQNFQETNASDMRGIDVVRSRIKDFARTKPINADFKIIFLDESDALTPDAQAALRRVMEMYADVTRFIFSCNYSSRIIPAIQSRAALFRFKALSENDVRKYVLRIVKGEKLKISEEAIKAIVEIAEGDLRKVANLLQASAALGKKITADTVYEVASRAKPADVREMLELALKGKFEDARKKLQDMLLRQGLSGSDIISSIHKEIYSLDLPDEAKVQLVEKCGEYDFRISEGGNELIQLEALLAQFLLFSKKK
jgi:replication factor C small subunit